MGQTKIVLCDTDVIIEFYRNNRSHSFLQGLSKKFTSRIDNTTKAERLKALISKLGASPQVNKQSPILA